MPNVELLLHFSPALKSRSSVKLKNVPLSVTFFQIAALTERLRNCLTGWAFGVLFDLVFIIFVLVCCSLAGNCFLIRDWKT